MKTIGEIVAQNVRRERQRLGLSQSELAEKAKVSLHTVFRLEAGNTNPQKKNLEAIAKALGCKQKEDLFQGLDSKVPQDILEALAHADSDRLDDIRLLLRLPILKAPKPAKKA